MACIFAEPLKRSLSTEGSDGLVTSPASSIATGRNDSCRRGLPPPENKHLCTTHDNCFDNEILLRKRFSGVNSASPGGKTAPLAQKTYQPPRASVRFPP